MKSKQKQIRIGVDLIPVSLGGEVGGAKKLIINLLEELIKNSTDEKYVLFTSKENHSLFEKLEKMGAQRVCLGSFKYLSPPNIIDSEKITSAYHFLFFKLVFKINIILRAWRFFNKKIRYFLPYGILKKEKISVLFLPWNVPVYANKYIPSVSLVYDLQDYYYPQFFSIRDIISRNSFYSDLQKKIDHIITISNYTKETIIEKLKIPTQKITTILISNKNSIKINSIEDTEKILEKYKINGVKYFYFPANFWRHKNHIILLIAFNLLVKRYTSEDVHLVFTGTLLDTRPDLEDAVEKMQLKERVHFLGYVSEKDISAIWSGCFSLIFPSLFEGFGIPLLESMVFKKPILCSDSTCLPEIAREAAKYFNPHSPDDIAEAMFELLSDKDIYKTLVEKGQDRLRFFDDSQMVFAYRSILLKIAKTKEGII